jgi:hypothetical protein
VVAVSDVFIHATYDDTVAVRHVAGIDEYRVKIGGAWLHLPRPLFLRLMAAMDEQLRVEEIR